MTGAYHITVSNRYVKYDFTIQRNITVIRGNSATGKTTLIEMIREYQEAEDSGIYLNSEKPCVVLYGRDWEERLKRISGAIVFIDESSRFSNSEAFASAIQGTDNYYVIVSRERLANLPFSIREIYGIRESGKYNRLESPYTLNEFYQIYGEKPEVPFTPGTVITEDTNSGYTFWKHFCNQKDLPCEAAGGKSRVLKKIRDLDRKGGICLAIVDGAAFGSEMELLMEYIRYQDKEIRLYAPESFEYLILSSGILPSKEIARCLEKTYLYADSAAFISWERYYTHLLTEETRDTEKCYQKSRLNPYYLSEKVSAMILEQMPDVIRWETEEHTDNK